MNIRVIGLGNVQKGDEGFGPCVIATLEASCGFPESVCVMDLESSGLDLAPYVTGCDALIVIDTVNSEGAPGELRLHRRDELLRFDPHPRLSPHDPGLKKALLLAELSGAAPHTVLLVGVIPQRTESAPGLTAPVHRAVSYAASQVIREIERLGVPVTVHAAPCPPPAWWES